MNANAGFAHAKGHHTRINPLHLTMHGLGCGKVWVALQCSGPLEPDRHLMECITPVPSKAMPRQYHCTLSLVGYEQLLLSVAAHFAQRLCSQPLAWPSADGLIGTCALSARWPLRQRLWEGAMQPFVLPFP